MPAPLGGAGRGSASSRGRSPRRGLRCQQTLPSLPPPARPRRKRCRLPPEAPPGAVPGAGARQELAAPAALARGVTERAGDVMAAALTAAP